MPHKSQVSGAKIYPKLTPKPWIDRKYASKKWLHSEKERIINENEEHVMLKWNICTLISLVNLCLISDMVAMLYRGVRVLVRRLG